MWLAHEISGKSSVVIGRAFARDHTSVLYALRQVDNLRARDPKIAADIATLRVLLRQCGDQP